MERTAEKRLTKLSEKSYNQQIGCLTSNRTLHNGAWVGELSSRKTLFEARLDRSIAIEAMALVHGMGGSAIWFDLETCYVLEPDEEVARRRTSVTGDNLELIRDPNEAPGSPFKLLATFPVERIDEAIFALSKSFDANLIVVQSGPNLVEIVRADARKDLAADFIAQFMDIKVSEVAAAGDAGNDLKMLQWAGLAITVANAKPEIQAAADIVAPSCDDGGLAVVLGWLVEQLRAEECKRRHVFADRGY